MKIERVDNEIIIKISADTDRTGLERLLNFLRLREITSKSSASQEQIDEQSEEIKFGWWKKNRDKFPR